MLRTLWFYTAFLGLTPLYCLAMLIFAPWNPAGKIAQAISTGWCRLPLRFAGLQIEADLSALENLPENTPLIFMANHQSQFDIPIIMSALSDYYPAFMAKKSLFNIPLLGWSFAAGGHIPVDRSNRRKAMQSLEYAVKTAQKGRSILIYPEGTRQKSTEKLGKFKTGGMIIALKSGLPVVPVVLEGTGNILPKGSIALNNHHKVQLKALPPVATAEYSLKDRNAFCDTIYTQMNTTYQEMRACRTNTTS